MKFRVKLKTKGKKSNKLNLKITGWSVQRRMHKWAHRLYTHARTHSLSRTHACKHTFSLSLTYTHSLSRTHALSHSHTFIHTRVRDHSFCLLHTHSLSFSHTQHSSSAYGRSPCESLRGCFEMSGRLRTDQFSFNTTVLIVSFVYLFINLFLDTWTLLLRALGLIKPIGTKKFFFFLNQPPKKRKEKAYYAWYTLKCCHEKCATLKNCRVKLCSVSCLISAYS